MTTTTSYLGRPKGSNALLFIQVFSTLSFSVLYFSLVLYMTKFLHFSDKLSTSIMASFVAFNFALHLFGGYLGGRFFSYRSLFCISMVLQGVGCLLISGLTPFSLYWGLAAFLAGSGLNVTCINCMLTQLFEPNDHRSEGAFLWNYSGMNIGFVLGITLSGYLQLTNRYHSLFFLSSFSNLLAIALTFLNWRHLFDRHSHYSTTPKNSRNKNILFGTFFIVTLIPSLHWLMHNSLFSSKLVIALGCGMAIVIAALAMKQNSAEARKKIWAYLILAISGLVFWTLYQLMPMGLTLFIERNVDRHVGTFEIPTPWFQNIDPFIVILGGPFLAWFFQRLRSRGLKLTVPIQFSIALLLIGIGFVILPIGIKFANSQGYMSASWIIACYVLQTVGELFISPIGYSMIGDLAPRHLQGVFMGTWLMVTGVAATMSGYFTNMASGQTSSTNPLLTNSSYSHTFNLLGWTAVVFGIGMIILVPFLHTLIQNKQGKNQENTTPQKEPLLSK